MKPDQKPEQVDACALQNEVCCVLTVFGFRQLRAVFGAAIVDVVRTEHVGATLEANTDLSAELLDLVC